MVNSELIILGMIYFNPSHGYALKKNVKETFGNPNFELNNNILYSTLRKLEKNGFITGKEIQSEKMNKKVYHITNTGKKHLLELVATPVNPDIDRFDFNVQAAFFDLIPKEARKKVVKPLFDAQFDAYHESLKKKEKFGPYMSPISLTVLEYGIKELEISLKFYEKIMEI
ncbi:MAG: PadR family transcriptional regulator [Methanobacterium sp.]